MNRLQRGRMTTEQTDTTHQVWGAPEPSPARWGWRETAAAVAVAAVIAGLGGAAVYAATAGTSHTVGGPHQAFGPRGGMPGGGGGMPGGAGGPAGPGGPRGAFDGPAPAAVGAASLHGEFVVPDGAGGYATVLTQSGAVTAISPTSITVRSDDGYTQTYVIPSTAGNAGAPFAVDDRIVVRATRDGQTATVTNIGNPMPGGPPGPNGPGGAPPHHN
jgi:hypothetical protein